MRDVCVCVCWGYAACAMGGTVCVCVCVSEGHALGVRRGWLCVRSCPRWSCVGYELSKCELVRNTRGKNADLAPVGHSLIPNRESTRFQSCQQNPT